MMTTIFILQTRYQLLIAGSSGWNNYRHQADVMALSTLLHSNSSNIVTTMMKNDIVNHEDNPYPGKLFNTLKTSDNYNIYNKDYINSSIITLDNMKDLMKNFNFTHDDIITIYYNDHGAPGLLCSPYNNDPSNREFFADDINDYLKEIMIIEAKNSIDKLIQGAQIEKSVKVVGELSAILKEINNPFWNNRKKYPITLGILWGTEKTISNEEISSVFSKYHKEVSKYSSFDDTIITGIQTKKINQELECVLFFKDYSGDNMNRIKTMSSELSLVYHLLV